MTYIITFFCSYKEQILNTDSIHTLNDIYEVDNTEACIHVIKDILDIPITELSLESIKHDFESIDLTEEKAVQIQTYYNGRLALFNTITNDLNFWNSSDNTTCKYNIPKEYASFDKDDNYIESYIEIKKIF